MAFTEAEKKQLEANAKYWSDRGESTQEKLTTKSIKETEKQLIKYFQSAQEKIIGQFEKTFIHLISTIEEGNKPTPADLYKLDTYWKMQGQVREELEKLGNKQAALLSKQFEEQYISIYNSLALPSETAFTTINSEAAKQVINEIWCADGMSWTQRIWSNTAALQEKLNDGIIECVVNGRTPAALKHNLMDAFGVSYTKADTLVRTEMAHIQTQATRNKFLEAGIQEVEIWASKDERRCEICGKLHEKRFPIGGKMPIPAHPRCRCRILPVIE